MTLSLNHINCNAPIKASAGFNLFNLGRIICQNGIVGHYIKYCTHIFVMRDLFGINADWVITNNTYEIFLMGNKGNALH